MSDQQPSPLDQAYQALGGVTARLEGMHRDQQQALKDLQAREQELLAKLDKAEPGTPAHQQLTDELDELTRAWRVATSDVEAGP